MTQLTLQLDDELAHRAKAYSVRTGQPLADLVAGYLASLTAEPARAAGTVRDSSASSDSLPQRQYRLADQYPGQFVVLVGERVIHHSADRAEAGRAYRQRARSASHGPRTSNPSSSPASAFHPIHTRKAPGSVTSSPSPL